jgi:hypothetical protein
MKPLVLDFWRETSPSGAKSAIDFLLLDQNLGGYLEILMHVSELSEYFCSYCWILKDEPEVIELINKKDFPTPLLCQLIYHSLGRYQRDGNVNNDFFLASWCKNLSPEQSYRLLRDEPRVETDIGLKIHLLANLDARSWEDLFETLLLREKGVSDVIEIFQNIDPLQRKRLFYRNPTLYQYLRMVLVVESAETKNEFLGTLEESLNEIYQWEEYAKSMRSSFQPEQDKGKSPRDRNANRLSCLLHDATKLSQGDPMAFLEYLTIQDVIVDEREFNMLSSLVKNPEEENNFF